MEKGVFLIFSMKDIQLAALLYNSKGPKNIHQFYWERRSFPWPLVLYKFLPDDTLLAPKLNFLLAKFVTTLQCKRNLEIILPVAADSFLLAASPVLNCLVVSLEQGPFSRQQQNSIFGIKATYFACFI